jgi:zinc/manganese transport system permease protein
MIDTALLELLLWPMVACVVLAGIHCYLGIHVLMRGVIFVDLALAQVAALGAAIAIAMGHEPGSIETYAGALALTIVGAGVFAVAKFDEERVPQEAVIGIVYAVASAVALLVLSQSAMDRDEIEHMLTGHLLIITPTDVWHATLIYSAVAVVHIICRKPFMAISRADRHDAVPRARLWDFLFYASFGVVVTSSVHLAGVLLVFCFLIVPAASAALFSARFWPRLVFGWILGLIASVVGLWISATADTSAGPSVVAAFGGVFLAVGILRVARPPRDRAP